MVDWLGSVILKEICVSVQKLLKRLQTCERKLTDSKTSIHDYPLKVGIPTRRRHVRFRKQMNKTGHNLLHASRTDQL